jgi:hypothetical protein
MLNQVLPLVIVLTAAALGFVLNYTRGTKEKDME